MPVTPSLGDAADSLSPALPGVPPHARSWEKGFSVAGGGMGEYLAWLLSSLRPISSGGRKKTAVCVGPR